MRDARSVLRYKLRMKMEMMTATITVKIRKITGKERKLIWKTLRLY
jgi:hypothetical protein